MYNAISHNVFHFPASEKNNHNQANGIFKRAATLGLQELHCKSDPTTGLRAIIALHNLNRGPALGGTRCLAYPSEAHAIEDAMRLAQGMSYKSAFAHLPYGGGKAVLIRPDKIKNIEAYFESYGEFIETLKGRFITAVDVGTRVEDMDIIARKTKYVVSTSASYGDPSEDTAKGVLRSMFAAVKAHLQKDNLYGLTIAIQGTGKVGFHLARLLSEHDVSLIVSDISQEAAQRCAENFSARIVQADKIMGISCDVLSPCALGSSIDLDAANLIKASIICGAANNQLVSEEYADILYKRKIFYVPDFVANAGGLIHVIYGSSLETENRISYLYNSVIDLYQRSQATHQSSHSVAIQIAETIIANSNSVAAAM
jgi:leucine dehydrogenase